MQLSPLAAWHLLQQGWLSLWHRASGAKFRLPCHPSLCLSREGEGATAPVSGSLSASQSRWLNKPPAPFSQWLCGGAHGSKFRLGEGWHLLKIGLDQMRCWATAGRDRGTFLLHPPPLQLTCVMGQGTTVLSRGLLQSAKTSGLQRIPRGCQVLLKDLMSRSSPSWSSPLGGVGESPFEMLRVF